MVTCSPGSDFEWETARFAPARPPRVCILGPMLGRNPGYVTSQGEILADLLASRGVQIISASTIPGRLRRWSDILRTLNAHRREIDVVCVQTYSGRSFLVEDSSSWLAKRLKLPLILHLHGGAMPEFIDRYPRWTRRVLTRADRMIAPSPYLARAVEQRTGLRVDVIPNVIELSDYQYRPRRHLRPRMFWMRAFLPPYNPAMALRVLARVRAKYPDATLVMAGQDKHGALDTFRAEAARLGLADAVRFPGFLDRRAKAETGDDCDLFLNTNRIDNMPVAVVEAGAMGLPVVATRVGGLPDLLEDGRTGLLVPDDDDAAMTEAVFRLLDEPDLAERLSTQGRLLAERSARENVLPLWESCLHEMAAR